MNGEHEQILVNIESLRGDVKALTERLDMFMEKVDRFLNDHEKRLRSLEAAKWKIVGLAVAGSLFLKYLFELIAAIVLQIQK